MITLTRTSTLTITLTLMLTLTHMRMPTLGDLQRPTATYSDLHIVNVF